MMRFLSYFPIHSFRTSMCGTGMMIALVSSIAVSSVGAQGVAGGQTATGKPATGNPANANANAVPFPPLSTTEQNNLDTLLKAWETQSNGTKTLECRFKRWHFDLFAAPAGIASEVAQGVIRYATPDRGYFKVEQRLTYDGMKEGKPVYSEKPGQFGEHWVCNGEELLEFDHAAKECKIQQLPPEMRGQKIFESPLPFVFNLDAVQIQNRYWVRQVQAPKPGILLIEAYPKRQEDRAQYKMVQIALSETTFLPEALLMYAPNFNIKTAPKWDHYEFVDVKRNTISQGLIDRFRNTFIDEKPPTDWKVFRNAFRPPGPPQIAERPTAQPLSQQR